ncbi:unnamed protein product [Medioppia subpectinata]|uniref:Uncharacterized protein n=1 Tax=Medioppia subpectinata TaxID=1979941 RepID=A0A7R9Q5Z2_9ACAR|nr:unnamed protein product [Medioppia subpectinata]CAG2113352.1 unnamed protein product [Medioppia subpectinata]
MDSRLTCRKWTLFTMCLINMVSTIVILILSVKEFNSPQDHYIWKIAGLNKHTVKIIMISAFTVAIVTQLVGIWGAYKTNYCVCIIYGLIMIIAFIVSVLPALYTGYNAIWFLTGWFFLCSCFATSFASAIRRCRATRPALMGAQSRALR